MKKICLLLAMLFALTCIPAFAAEGDAILGITEDNTLGFNYCFGLGDTLYLATYAGMYTYRVGDADLTEYDFDVPQELLESGDSLEITTLPFCADDKLYAINLVTKYTDTTEFDGAQLAEVTLNSDGSASFTTVCDVDWSELVEYYDNSSYPLLPDSILGVSGQALVRYYDDMGNFKTASVDLTDGSMSLVDALDDAYTVTPYRDGTVLAEVYNPDIDEMAKFVAYDPASESVEALGELEVMDYIPYFGMAYDPETDTLYCAKGGEICPVDLQAGTVGEGVADMPLDVYTTAPACILEGSYYGFGSSGAVIRNLDPQQKAQTKLKINDTYWSDSVNTSYYRFANAHGDVSVVLSREYTEIENLIESMMNRDDSVDIYVLSTSTSDFEALYNRGYLMDLDGSDKVKELAERMYPSLRDELSVDGHLVAIPVSLYAWTMGVNEKALEKLGMKLEDVPDNWSDFLDFVAGLTGVIGEDSEVHLFYNGYTEADARYELLTTILTDYQYYVDYNNPEMGYDSDLLRSLVDKLEKIDFVALGCPAEMDEYDLLSDDYSEDSVLLQPGIGCNIGNMFGDYTPVLMRIDADAPAYLSPEAMVVVVNPFTKNPEAAQAFVDEVVGNLSISTQYCLIPDMNDPVRGEQNQALLDEVQEEVDELTREYESASAEEKQDLEEDLRDTQNTLDYIQAYNWDVSPRELEWYRANDDDIITSNYNWLYAETSDSDDSGFSESAEAMDLIEQYLSGQISANDMLTGIDRKVQMRRLEGN